MLDSGLFLLSAPFSDFFFVVLLDFSATFLEITIEDKESFVTCLAGTWAIGEGINGFCGRVRGIVRLTTLFFCCHFGNFLMF
jgi:hypothetical protein